MTTWPEWLRLSPGPGSAMEYTGLSRSYLYNKIGDRTLPSYKQGRRVLLRKRDVDAWMESNKREAI